LYFRDQQATENKQQASQKFPFEFLNQDTRGNRLPISVTSETTSAQNTEMDKSLFASFYSAKEESSSPSAVTAPAG
jgi:hypothetical protein